MGEACDRERVEAARVRLLQRRLEAGRAPLERPMGKGPPNRHGMPRLPIGQNEVRKWPVLDLGTLPEVRAGDWTLRLDGACRNPLTLTRADFLALEQAEDTSDFHCVTTWSLLDVPWRGVRFFDLAALADPFEEVEWVMAHARDGYTTNVRLDDALQPDVLLVHTAFGEPLAREHGGPLRMITPRLYAWKGAKWIHRIEFLAGFQRGYWEDRGYSDTADPWRDDRYS